MNKKKLKFNNYAYSLSRYPAAACCGWVFHSGHHVLIDETDIDDFILLKNTELNFNEKFKSKPIEVIATTGAWILSKKI